MRLYDTLTRQVRDFVPLRPGHVGIYHCGLTLQGPPHIGHIRKELVFDVLRRWLEHRGFEVTVVANVTDIDDKVLHHAAETGREWWAIAYANELALHRAYDVLGCRPPTYEPRATGHIPQMVELMQTLLDRGHAYPAGDGSGDVYFDVRSWPAYGELSRQRLADMEPAEDADPRAKRDPHDFALWKGHKADEPATACWSTPYGPGRPGWHLECSAMAGRYLGAEFDIHGGGLDLAFPHHENELAQSRAAGRGFARYWMHNGLVNLGGGKMSKSIGNVLLVSEVARRVRPVELRFYLTAAHYRSEIDFSFEALEEVGQAYRRIEGFVLRASEVTGAPAGAAGAVGAGGGSGVVAAPDAAVPAVGAVGPGVELDPEFVEAMDDDLAVPTALAALQRVVREGNKLLADGDSPELRANLAATRAMLGVFGVDPLAAPWRDTAGVAGPVAGAAAAAGSGQRVLGELVSQLLAERQLARARRDFAAADALRDRLAAAGVVVEDTPQGPRWTLAP